APPRLAIDPLAPARLGQVMNFDGSALLPTRPGAWLAVGLSDQSWAGGSLPFPLDGFGMTGCALQTSTELFLFAPLSTAGTAQWGVALPSITQLLGIRLFGQILAEDPGANAAGIVVSRPIAVTAGW
ncbi:MAG: hypothetical protein KDC98_02495, partial [Planctomycetes bacterium]|nr:hypothetical protein [Planctomycetota bacterium]